MSGEHRIEVSADYLVAVVERLRSFVPSLSVETQTWSDDTYARLVAAGLEGVVHYQETYDRARYAEVHVAGWKRNFDRRLAAMERAGVAGARRLGVGALLGLSPDWRHDVLAVAAHAAFLQRRFWRAEVTVALPRITPSASGFQPVVSVPDAEFVQALAALRLALPDAGLVLSTREPAPLRDGLARIAVTSMSAGSSTEPGGYGTPGRAQEQFSDRRHALARGGGADAVRGRLRARVEGRVRPGVRRRGGRQCGGRQCGGRRRSGERHGGYSPGKSPRLTREKGGWVTCRSRSS